MSDHQPLAIPDPHLRFLLDASPVGMLVFNNRGEIVLANPPAERLFGFDSQRTYPERCGDAIRCANRLKNAKGCGHADTCPSCPLFQGLQATFAGTATAADQEGEAALDREAGYDPLWIRYKIRPLIVDGEPGAILSVDDITTLYQSEERYAMLFREMFNAFALHEIIFDDQGRPIDYRFLVVNPAFERMTGLSSSQIIGRTVLDVLPGIDSHWIATYGRVARTGQPVQFEHYSREIGKYFSINAFCPRDGQVACLFEDITERKRAEQELATSEANYRSAYTLLRSLCDNVPDMIWAKDLGGRYLFANTAMCRGLLNAADTEEPLGKTDLFFAKRERSSHADQPQWHTFGELCRDTDTTTIAAGVPMQFDEFGNVQGQFLFLDVHKAPFLDENGTMIGTVGSARDVTAVKAMEQQLKEREERLDLAIRGGDLGTWDWHIPSGVIVINERWAEMLGLPTEQLVSHLDFWTTRVHPDDIGRVNAALARHLRGETESYETEHRLRHQSGDWIWVLDKGRVIERDALGNPLRACGTHLDITRLKILVEQSRDGIVILDSQGKVREANQRFADMLGYTPEEMQQLHVWDWDARMTREQLQEAIDLIDATGDFFETTHRRKNGTTYPVEISSNGSLSSGEKQVFCICRDISERKQAEEALKEQELFLRTITRSTRDAILVMDSFGRIAFWNPAAETIFGYTEQEAIGTHLHQLLVPQCYHQAFEEAFPLFLQSGEGYAIGRLLELEALRKSGHNFPVELSLSAFHTMEGWHTVGVIRDITERRQTDQRIRESRDFLNTLLNAIPVRVFWKDMDLRYLGCNRAFAQDAGYTSPDELIGLDDFALVWRDQAAAYRADDHEVLASGIPKILYEEAQTTPSGEQLYLLTSKLPLKNPVGAIVGILGVYSDVTELKRMEEDKSRLQSQLVHAQKMEAIGTLAGGIAHDFNNILGAVIGYAEMAREDSPPGSAIARDLDRVLEAGKRAAALVKQILAFSRQQESGKVPVDPGLIVKEVVKLLRPSLPSTITINHRITSRHKVHADPTQLHQIFMNLSTNAFHAMEQTGGRLEIVVEDIDYTEADLALHPGIVPGSFVRLSVADTGPGIPGEIRNRIFDPYFTTKEVGKGTGMGLAIVDGIVRSSSGFVTCESESGKGTVFTIALPTCASETAGMGEKTEPLATGTGHILFVDDEEILIEMGQTMLERLGYTVTVCTSSLEALAKFQNDPRRFDAVITDQTMPGMTGLDLARRMLQIRPELPIILCTGYSNLVNEAQAKAYGIKGFAMKPLTKKDIAALLRAAMTDRDSVR